VDALRTRDTPIAGMKLVQTRRRLDERGAFERLFCREEFAPIRPELAFVQINLSTTSVRGCVRGMHFQRAPALEAKLIRCVRGHVFDVTLDLRRGSPTFLQWHAVELREDEAQEVFIPEGCAHGFQALSADAMLLYLHTAAYAPESEGGVRVDDPRIAIAWPLPVTGLSPRDRSHPLLDEHYAGLEA
jgi:dTDP-4-dehydrorhamnose 3,5-epimerase